MKESSFPPRLRTSEDPAVRNVMRALAEDAIEPSHAAQALARLEASEALAVEAAQAPRRSQWSTVAKVFLASVVALGALKTATFVGHEREGSPAPISPAVVAATAAPSAPAPEPAPAALRIEDLPSVAASAEPAAPSVAVRAPKQAASTASAAASASTFREELALVQSARASLKGGETESCLRTLDHYDRRYHGVFVDEVAVIRIEALLARGERDRARTTAESFLAKHPDSPYENRIRSLLSKIP